MKAVVAAFNQEKALVGAFSVITNLRMQLFEALLSSVFMTRRHNARQLIAGNKNLIFNGNIWNITHQHEVDNEFHCFVGQWNCPVGGNFVNTVDRQLVLATELRGISQCPEKGPTRGLLRAHFVIHIQYLYQSSKITLNIGVSIHPECLFKTFSAWRWLQWPPYICRRVQP